jgi:rod shape-determining protein MreC
MPLGTLDRTPPPFFRQGPSARTKLVFFAALALFLMVADNRFRVATTLREGLAIVLLPVQRVLLVPVQMLGAGGTYLLGLQEALDGERQARAGLAQSAEKSARADRLATENEQLRGLLGLRPMLPVRSLAAEVMYEAADPYSRKLFINAGLTQGVRPGSPVVNDRGVIGQVTRVYALSAEVTLLADKDAAIPVLNTRTQQRSAAFGGIQGTHGAAMELRFIAGNADVQSGDLLQTSGVDGVYPPGLPVARVVSVERRVESTFARVLLAPLAPLDAVRHVLVLEPLTVQLPPRPEPAAPASTKAAASTAARASAPSAASAAEGVRP